MDYERDLAINSSVCNSLGEHGRKVLEGNRHLHGWHLGGNPSAKGTRAGAGEPGTSQGRPGLERD